MWLYNSSQRRVIYVCAVLQLHVADNSLILDARETTQSVREPMILLNNLCVPSTPLIYQEKGVLGGMGDLKTSTILTGGR